MCGHIVISVTQRISSLEFWHRTSKYNECYCDGRLRSVIVTPSIVRDVRDANLLSIWNAALEDLRQAHQWIFIGYSLPPEDVAIRSLLLRAFHIRRSKRLRVRVVQYVPPEHRGNNDALERARYRAFFPDDHLRDRDYSEEGVERFAEWLKVPSPARVDRRLHPMFGRSSR
jgi:hypothetical protein